VHIGICRLTKHDLLPKDLSEVLLNMTMDKEKNAVMLSRTVNIYITEYRAHLAKVAHENISSE
jgi:hypothetical protein